MIFIHGGAPSRVLSPTKSKPNLNPCPPRASLALPQGVGNFSIRPQMRPRTGCAVFLTGAGRGLRHHDPRHCWPADRKPWETNRNPNLLFELFGLFLLRLATRALSRLLFHEPPRTLLSACPHATRFDICYRHLSLLTIFRQPPSRRPTSLTISAAWRYWLSFNNSISLHSRR